MRVSSERNEPREATGSSSTGLLERTPTVSSRDNNQDNNSDNDRILTLSLE